MIYAQAPNEQVRDQLHAQLKKAADTKWYRRLKIIQLSMDGQSVTQLAERFDLSTATVRHYIKAYNAGGIEQLAPGKSPGRPPKVGHLTRDDWNHILSRTPDRYEKLNTDSRQWTLDLLVRYAKEYLGETVCFQTISAALKRCKFRSGQWK